MDVVHVVFGNPKVSGDAQRKIFFATHSFLYGRDVEFIDEFAFGEVAPVELLQFIEVGEPFAVFGNCIGDVVQTGFQAVGSD